MVFEHLTKGVLMDKVCYTPVTSLLCAKFSTIFNASSVEMADDHFHINN